MFCPKCKAEYRKGFTECPDCKVPLVKKLLPEPKSPSGPDLKSATLSVIIGISYIFVSRTIGTFLPDIFKNLLIAQISVIISFLASLTPVFFFISFYEGYVRKEQIQLKKASVLAVIGSSAMSLLHIKGLLLVFDIYVFPYLVRSHFIEPIVPLVSSIFILLFFIIFHKEERKLKKATLSAIIGSSIAVLLRTFILFNYLYSGKIRWFSDLPRKITIILIPLFIFSFITVLYFFLSFYKEQKRIS